MTVSASIDDLRLLKDGWLDGIGRAANQKGLDWLAATFQRVNQKTDQGMKCVGVLALSVAETDLATARGFQFRG
jgi:hypothetical protein